MVEEDKERPVNEPCPLLERLERGSDGLDRTKIEMQAGGNKGRKVKKKPRRDGQRKKKKKKSNFKIINTF